MDDERMPPDQERGILAGEYALGVLEGKELAVARQLVLSDRAFAGLVNWWDTRLGAMAEEAASIEPSDGVWPTIKHRLAAISPGTQATALSRSTGLYGAKLLAALSATAAVAAAVTLLVMNPSINQPSPAPTATETPSAAAPRYIAQAQSEDGSIRLAGLVDTTRNVLDLKVEGLDPAQGQAAELWAVPEGGAPKSLGSIPDDGNVSIELDTEQQRNLATGAALAITYENSAGIPHPAPTTEILIVGPLSRI